MTALFLVLRAILPPGCHPAQGDRAENSDDDAPHRGPNEPVQPEPSIYPRLGGAVPERRQITRELICALELIDVAYERKVGAVEPKPGEKQRRRSNAGHRRKTVE